VPLHAPIRLRASARCLLEPDPAFKSDELLRTALSTSSPRISRSLGGIEPYEPSEDLPEAHIRADINTPWRCVGGAIYTMQMAGFPKVGFISQPDPGSIKVQRL
jgi:biopolymer transport protein ExbD